MKSIKIILAIVCGVLFIFLASNSVLAFVFGVLTILIMYDGYKEYAKGKRAAADLYYSQKKEEADNYYEKQLEESNAYRKNLEMDLKELKAERDTLQMDLILLESKVSNYENLRSDEIKNQLSILQTKQDDLVKSGKAIEIIEDSMAKKMQNNQIKQILRCFNSECASIIDSVTVKNLDLSRAKIQRSYTTINKIFKVDGVQLSYEYFSLKLEELSLVYSYMVKEEEEREQRKAIREQLVEEEKVRREIEREKQKIEKEEAQFSNEIKKLMAYMQKSKDDIERNLYIEKIKDLETKLKKLEEDKQNVLNREQNTRAGFVYIISNIGSFGENVFKIGMTRRLNPLDRINELSSASVPFVFDVHAMIFSDDAPALEAILHQTFAKYQVNKVNARKEFFRINLEEIKRIVKEHHNATVKFVDIPDAFEYRETMRIESKE